MSSCPTRSIEMKTLERIWPELSAVDEALADRLATDARYSVYLTSARATTLRASSATKHGDLPSDLAFDAMPGLSNELRQKLALVRPQTLGQASRIEGMTPAGLRSSRSMRVRRIRQRELEARADASATNRAWTVGVETAPR